MQSIKTLPFSGRTLGLNGVDVFPDHLTWWEMEDPGCRFAGGGACDQNTAEFLEKGPPIEGVPAEIVAEVRAILQELEGKGGLECKD